MSTQTLLATPCEFKGSLFTLTVLHLYTAELSQLEQVISQHIAKAPQFFHQAPIILDANALSAEPVDYYQLSQLLRKHQLIPIGVRGATQQQTATIMAAGLAILPNSQQTTTSTRQAKPSRPLKPTAATNSLIIEHPVRSGQQIYAKNADLIILNSVSHGAELLADGNIHVYGILRGRALAGINGNVQARIFCTTLAAELLSIAGIYQLSDDFSNYNNQSQIQVFLQQERLVIQGIQQPSIAEPKEEN